MNEIVVSSNATERRFMLPEERATLEIERISNEIFKVTTIQDAVKVCAMAEALAAATRNLTASERVRKDAAVLVLRAEARLGDITSSMPKRVGRAPLVGPTKLERLKQHGLNQVRANRAEALARAPKPLFERACEAQSRPTISGTLERVAGGKYSHPQPQHQYKYVRKLAMDAVAFICLLHRDGRHPSDDEAREYRHRLRTLEGRK